MRSPKEPLRQCKRQYFQYRHINKYSKQETIRRFNDDIFSATDQCGAFKIQFSQKNWNTAAAQWEEEWKIGTGGPPEEAWTEMSGLRLWYDGDRPLFHLVPAVPWYQPEPDKVRFRRTEEVQSARGIQLAADPGEMIMEPSSAFQNLFPTPSHGANHEARRHPNTTTPATSVLPWASTWPQNTLSVPAGFIPSSLPSVFEPTRMEDTSAQMNTSFEPSTMAGTPWQWAPHNNEGVQGWGWYQN